MKPSIAIALISAAVVLLALSPLASLLHSFQVSRLLRESHSQPSDRGTNSVYLREPITPSYSLACWSAGATVLVAVIWFSTGKRAGGC